MGDIRTDSPIFDVFEPSYIANEFVYSLTDSESAASVISVLTLPVSVIYGIAYVLPREIVKSVHSHINSKKLSTSQNLETITNETQTFG